MKKALLAAILITSAIFGCKKSDNNSSSDTNPTACFTVKHPKTGAGDADTFINCSANAASYSWDFGDTFGTSTAQNPTYGYSNLGVHTVTLTVYNSDKSKSSVATQTVTTDTADAYPSAVMNFGGNTTNFTHGVPVYFYDSSSTFTTSCLWNFGDGSTSTLNNPVHTYAAPSSQPNGAYTITLTVYHDTKALQNTTTRVIDMN